MFGNRILELLGQQDPRLQLLAAAGGGSGTPAGAEGAPGTGAPAQPQEARAYQSPQDLQSLYSELMKRARKEQLIDRGIGLIGASIAHPENRAGILSMFSGGGGEEDAGSFIQSIMKMQQDQQAIAQKAAQRAAVPAIAAQYGLDVTTAQYLFDTGKLDSVIAELEKPDRQVVQGADGKSYIVDKATGTISEGLGPEKQREIELVDDGRGGKIAVYKDTKEPVGANNIPGMGPTSDVQTANAINEDRAKRGLPPLPLEDAINQTGRARAGASNLGPSGIDYGNPPKDMAWKRNPDGSIATDESGAPIAIPIAGSELASEREEATRKAGEQRRQRSQTATVVLEELDKAKSIIEELEDSWIPATGLGGVAAPFMPNTPHFDAYTALETVKSNIGFDKLQEMRANSPTGGALGQVSDFENRLLQATMGSLDMKQRAPSLLRNMQRIRRIYEKLDDVLMAPDMESAQEAARDLDAMLPDASSVTDEGGEIDELLKKYGG